MKKGVIHNGETKEKSSFIDERKVELAKTIASQSETIKRSYLSFGNEFVKLFKWISNWFDKLLFNHKYSLEISLILAIVLYFGVNSLNDFTGTTSMSAKVFNDVPLTTEINTSVYEVSGLPETVTLNLMGDLADISLATAEKQNVVADLSGLGEGVHNVKLQATGLSSHVNAVIEPSSVTVTIAKKISQEFTIGYDFVNTSNMDSIYVLNKPEFEKDTVIVRASESTIKNISVVKALIDVSNVTQDFTTEATLVAYDQKGDRLNVDIVPEKVVANVKVSTPSKEVPINVIPQGEIPNGKAIASITLNHSSVLLTGPQSILDTISVLDILLPVYGFDQETNSVTMPITLPTGVRKKNPSTVSITVTLAERVEKEVEGIAIEYRNRGKWKPTISESQSSTVTVTVSGAQQMLDKLEESGIKAYIDLNDVPEDASGTIEVPLYIEGTNKALNYTSTTTKIKINITK